ncbi:MAG: SDR family oxidoreductase [Chloroflexaceae bacterium]|nr:SDR family oxidoreductase [Chloroflexaceae bacterium]
MTVSPPALRAIITGASSGIGRATAIAFAQAGIGVALVGRSQDKLAAVKATIEQAGGTVKTYTVDLSELSQTQRALAAIAADFSPIDILVNSAGMGYTNPLSQTSLKDWQQVLDLNLTSVFQGTLGVLPALRDRQGSIINVASIAASSAFPDWGAYSVSKAGLVAFSKTLAVEERSHGIRVMIISPGAVATPLWDSDTVQANLDRSAMLTPEAVAQAIVQAVLLPRCAVVEQMTLLPSAGAL